MTELDKAVRRFREVRRRNAAFLSRALAKGSGLNIARPREYAAGPGDADEVLFTLAGRRLRAMQNELSANRKEAVS